MKWISIAVLLLFGCGVEHGSGYNKFLRKCNQVEIVVFNGGDTLFFNTQDSTGIRILTNQVTGANQQPKDTCAPEGFLRYRQDSTLLLQARFAVSQDRCRFISYAYDDYNFAHRMSERATKLLRAVVEQAGKQ